MVQVLWDSKEHKNFLVRYTENNENYDALFSGPDAEALAHDYATYLQLKLEPNESETKQAALGIMERSKLDEIVAAKGITPENAAAKANFESKLPVPVVKPPVDVTPVVVLPPAPSVAPVKK